MTRIVFLLLVLLFSGMEATSQKEGGNPAKYKKVIVGPGPEDLVLDTVIGRRLIISCDNRRNNHIQGNIWQYDFSTGKAMVLMFKQALYFDFHPHGMHMITQDGVSYLFVINHIFSSHSEIDRFIVKKEHLVLDKRYQGIPGQPNDIFALSKDEFYYTSSKMIGGKIYHFVNDKAAPVIKGLKMPNGIYIENDTLYFTATLGNALFKAPLKTFKKKKVCKLKGGDNIMKYSKNEFLIASHQSFSKFMKHAGNPQKPSPSMIYKVNIVTGEKKVVFSDDGNTISAASTAVSYQNKLYIGQVFEDFILTEE